MKVVSREVDDQVERPASIGADIRCLNSGAVNRSISPATATTCVSSSTLRSAISKSIAIRRAWSYPAASGFYAVVAA